MIEEVKELVVVVVVVVEVEVDKLKDLNLINKSINK